MEKCLKEQIEEILQDCFSRIQNIYDRQCKNANSINESRLIFPKYRNGNIRVSEQELRFAFVESFNKYCANHNSFDYYYSIETPTLDCYKDFSTNPTAHSDKPNDPVNDYRSAEFDLVIFDKNYKRVCLIEFKAKNADVIDHAKDFLKLKNNVEGDGTVLRYFVELLESCDKKTLTNIKNQKLTNNKVSIGSNTEYRCYSLSGIKGNVTNMIK